MLMMLLMLMLLLMFMLLPMLMLMLGVVCFCFCSVFARCTPTVPSGARGGEQAATVTNCIPGDSCPLP